MQVDACKSLHRRRQRYQTQLRLSDNGKSPFRPADEPCKIDLTVCTGCEWLTVKQVIKCISGVAAGNALFRIAGHD
ncbi:MAG: hypothetical protein BWY89_00963 [Bacteroidetes bacterium ADurb.BinA012]|nr:MAG: hypothetical protein BWY89_00963 [Bacteroidetes bacterium ADurb.BinA012]